MPLETVQLDRVFGVTHSTQNRNRVTLFGFENANRKEYLVSAPGRPRIESGMVITAFLAEAGNWQTLVGWRDHESGEIVCEPYEPSIFACVWCAFALFMAISALRHYPIALALVSIVLITAMIRLVRRVFHVRDVRRELESSATTTGVSDMGRRYHKTTSMPKQLRVSFSASPFSEHYEMAYIHCRDVTTRYCFSLSRRPESDQIEVMVLDQINTKVSDLGIRLDGHMIYVELDPSIASRLDGHQQYEIELIPQEGQMPEVVATLRKIFEGKTGLQCIDCD